MPFEQVSDELIEEFGIQTGDYDSEAECRYSVPSVTSIGAVYQRLILDTSPNDPAQGILDVFSSFIAERFQISIPAHTIRIQIICAALIWKENYYHKYIAKAPIRVLFFMRKAFFYCLVYFPYYMYQC